MIKILATSPDLNFIKDSINKYFYSKDYYIEEDTLQIKNKNRKCDFHFRIRKLKNRFQFIYDSKEVK